jgi:hypothetical protein
MNLRTACFAIIAILTIAQPLAAALKYDSSSGLYYTDSTYLYNREMYNKLCLHCFTLAQQTISLAIATKANTSNREIRRAVQNTIKVYLETVVSDDWYKTAAKLHTDLHEYYNAIFPDHY